MAKRTEVTTDADRYIHEDLSDAAYYFRNVVRERAAIGDTKSLAMEMMACLVFIAFTVEARLNSIGFELLEKEWPERSSFEKKLALICHHLDIELQKGKQPFQTILKLNKFRNTLAHGKPEIVRNDVEMHEVEPLASNYFRGTWARNIDPKVVEEDWKQADRFWQILLEKSGNQTRKVWTTVRQTIRELDEPDNK